MEGRRITIIIDNDVNGKLLKILTKRVQKEQKSISYSRVLNDVLRKSL